MAKWNKVILSGSAAQVSSLTASNGILAGGDLTINGYLTASLNDGYIYIGNASNKSFPRLMSGDVTISNTGVSTIGGGKVTSNMLVTTIVNDTTNYNGGGALLSGTEVKFFISSGSTGQNRALTYTQLVDSVSSSFSLTGLLNLPSNRTGSFTGSFTGSLLGSSSYALTSSYSISSSYALTASYVTPGTNVLTYWTESESTYSGVKFAKFIPKSGDTDVSVVLQPKGYGAFTLSTPDGTSTGGNNRGLNAIDLQINRTSETQVASGSGASILGGWKNKISNIGDYSAVVNGEDNYVNERSSFIGAGAGNTVSSKFSAIVAGSGSTIGVTSDHSFIGGGQSNNIWANYNHYGVIVGGKTNTILDGQYASILGGEWNTTSASYSSVIGGAQTMTTRDYTIAFASGKVDNEGDGLGYAQTEFVNLTNTGNPAAPTTPFRLAQNSDLANWLRLRDNETITFKGIVTAREEGTSDRASFDINGCIFRDTGAASTVLIDSNVVEITNVPGWSVAMSANVTEGALVVTFTPTGADASVRVNCSLMYNTIV